MIKITSINRKVTSERVENSTGTQGATVIQTMDANCNVVMAADGHYNKGHFELTVEEGRQFDELAQRIEQRIVAYIADPNVGLEAVQPKPPEAEQEASRTASA